MSRMTTKQEELDRLAFAERAAACFRSDPKLATFSDRSVSPGSYLALRWGLGNDCVLVVKLDEYDEPINYQQLVRQS
jgi:hypothetical protein